MLSLLADINRSTDHFIQELKPLLSSNYLTQGTLDIPSACAAIFEAVGASVTSLPVLRRCKEELTSITTQYWDKHLQSLHVQEKLADVIVLEEDSHSWKKIMRNGLTSGQLSFLLRAGSDILPNSNESTSHAYSTRLEMPPLQFCAAYNSPYP